MLDGSNTPVRVRAEDQALIEAIQYVRRKYRFPDAEAEQLFNDVTKPEPRVRQWIFDLSDPAPRPSAFVTKDLLANFWWFLTRGRASNACWADLPPREQRKARGFARFVQDKKRVLMRGRPAQGKRRVGGGRPQNVDRALIRYVQRRIEERMGVAFKFSRPLPFCLGGPMLRLAEAALRRLFDDKPFGHLGLVSPARHYTRWEIARTAQLARARVQASETSPAAYSSDLILLFTSDVRIELADKKDEDQGGSSPSSWPPFPSSWREVFEAAVASGRQTRLNHESGLDVLEANLKSGALPDLIELAKGRCVRPVIPVAERILPDPPTSPPPSRDGAA